MRILLIEDDLALQTTLQRALQKLGWTVTVCGDGLQAVSQWESTRPDLVLLDLNLPGLDGLNVLAQARKQGQQCPVIILTARGTVGDRVLGLNHGADDYLPKPFDLDELEARIRALHRRHRATDSHPTEPATDYINLGHLRIDKSALGGAVFAGPHILDLSPRELALIHCLAQRPGHAVTKDHLIASVFANEANISDDAIEVVVYRLRKKIAGFGVTIMTLRGLGYLIKAQS